MNPGDLLSVVAAYLLGCLNAGYYLVCCRRGKDIRSHGSGNAGARNVGRLLGPAGFAVTFALDAAKGAIAVMLAEMIAPGMATPALCALVVVAGHVWPAQLDWRGGKGIATSFGAALALAALNNLADLAFVLPVLAALLVYTHRSNLSVWRRETARTRPGDSTP